MHYTVLDPVRSALQILDSAKLNWKGSSVVTNNLLSPTAFQAVIDGTVGSMVTGLSMQFRASFELISLYERYTRPLTGFGYTTMGLAASLSSDESIDGNQFYRPWGRVSSPSVEVLEDHELGDRHWGEVLNTLDTSGGDRGPVLAFIPVRKGRNYNPWGLNNWGHGNCENDYTSAPDIGHCRYVAAVTVTVTVVSLFLRNGCGRSVQDL